MLIVIAAIPLILTLSNLTLADTLPAPSPFSSADGQGSIGEVNTLYLLPDCVYVHPLNNDIAGKTDKHLTHSLRVGLLYNQTQENSYNFKFSWRFITPRHENISDPTQITETGNYGDWAELQGSRAFTETLAPDWLLKYQFDFGLGHLGPKGAKQIQVGIHKKLENGYEYLTWVQRQKGIVGSSGFKVALIPSPLTLFGGDVHQQIAAATNAHLVSLDLGAVYNMVYDSGGWFKFGGEARAIRQLQSAIYEGMRSWRYEFAAGLHLSSWYKPTISYVSPFLKNDGEGQVYFDAFNFNIPF